MKKANYGTIVLTVIGLMMCVSCSQVSFNNPFGEAQPNAAGTAGSDESSDKVDPQNAGKMPEHKIRYLNVKNADNSANPTSFKESETVMLMKVSISGCIFDGWYEVTDNIADTSTDGWAAGSKTADVTLWAKWTAINNDPTDPIEPVMPAAKVYTIKFDNNTGSGIMADITADVGATITLPACTFNAPTGKKFGSWNGKADGTAGINYADSASVKNLSETDGEVVTLYAQWIDKEAHRIIYQNIKNADNSSNPTYFMESESVALADVTTDGYTFDGWYDSSSDFVDAHHVSSWAAGEQTSDVILYAKWTANEVTYTVKRYFQNVSGSGYDATADIVKSGLTEAITDVTADTVTGFTALPIVQQSVAADGSAVVSVYYDRNVIVYTFNANGGSWNDDSNVKKAVGLYGAEVETPVNPARVGYTYAGWDKTLPTVFGETVETWTAQWTSNSYTIIFNANDGTGDMSNQDMTYDVETALTANAFSKTGYTFLGWSDSLSATAAKYTNSQNVLNLTATSGETVTLYAIWKVNTYNVIFYANGGTGEMSSMDMTYDVEFALTDNGFSKIGYTFQGWSENSSAASATYANKQSVSNLTDVSGGTVTLYAVWKANTYTVKFNVNGGTGSMANQMMTYDTSAKLNTNAFTRTGYTFQGWATSASGAKVYNDAVSVSNLSSKNNGTFNLYAVWKRGCVGDIMYSDMTFSTEYVEGKTPIGIVFEVGAKVKIVHLSQASKAWCLSSADGFKCNPPTSTSDGSGNWQIICDAVSDEGTAGRYPAFEYVNGLGSGWYLPARDELNAVYTNKTAINTALTALSNAGVSVTSLGTSLYWSSSSYYSDNDAWYQRFSDGYQANDRGKYSQGSVRAVRAF